MSIPARILVFLPLLLLLGILRAQAQVALPPNDGFVTDGVGLLTEEQDAELERVLTDYQQETSNEIAVVIVRSVSGADIAQTATDLLRRWGVGSAENNNGILLLIAYEDREGFVATGYGLEGKIPDIVARGIAVKDIAPRFRDGEYYEGVVAGVEAIQKHIADEYTADRYTPAGEGAGVAGWLLFLFLIAFDWLAAIFGRTRSWWLGGIVGAGSGILLTFLYSWWLAIPFLAAIGLVFDYVVSRGYRPGRGRIGPWGGGGGGWRGGSGRSSFRGFGGGSSGGGGARFRW